MALDSLPDLDPDDGTVESAEVAVTDDVLVKTFALGPGGEVEPHEHADATNVFHVIEGTVTVVRGDEEERIEAPGVVLNERGVVHGARNETDEPAILTATLAPFPG